MADYVPIELLVTAIQVLPAPQGEIDVTAFCGSALVYIITENTITEGSFSTYQILTGSGTGSSNPIYIPVSSIQYYESVAPGTYTYTATMSAGSGDTVYAYYARLVIREI